MVPSIGLEHAGTKRPTSLGEISAALTNGVYVKGMTEVYVSSVQEVERMGFVSPLDIYVGPNDNRSIPDVSLGETR